MNGYTTKKYCKISSNYVIDVMHINKYKLIPLHNKYDVKNEIDDILAILLEPLNTQIQILEFVSYTRLSFTNIFC